MGEARMVQAMKFILTCKACEITMEVDHPTDVIFYCPGCGSMLYIPHKLRTLLERENGPKPDPPPQPDVPLETMY